MLDTTAGIRLTDRDGRATQTVVEGRGLAVLGYSPAKEEILFGAADPETPAMAEGMGSERWRAYRSPLYGTAVCQWFVQESVNPIEPDDLGCRIRTNASGTLVSIPRFPTDVSAIYRLYLLAPDGSREETSPDPVMGRWWYWGGGAGVAFMGETAYFVRSHGWDATDNGVYRWQPRKPREKARAVIPIRDACGRELAVSGRLHLAAVCVWPARAEESHIELRTLPDGALVEEIHGNDPDLWPM